jgi:hypothetical protein
VCRLSPDHHLVETALQNAGSAHLPLRPRSNPGSLKIT